MYEAEKCLLFSTPQGNSCNVHEVPRLPLESTGSLDKSLSKAKSPGGYFQKSSPLAKSKFVLLATFCACQQKQHLHCSPSTRACGTTGGSNDEGLVPVGLGTCKFRNVGSEDLMILVLYRHKHQNLARTITSPILY